MTTYHLKSCPRCRGDMRQYLEPQDGKLYVQCLQCGHERALEPQEAPELRHGEFRKYQATALRRAI